MTETAETLQYKGILRFELFTGHQMFIDRDMSKAYIEIKIDGNTNLSEQTNKNDYSFGQVFHFYMKESSKIREMQILLCNVNKGGYIQKYTIAKKSLNEINLVVNEARNLVEAEMIKGKKMSICYALTFLVNPFIQAINGYIEACLVSINPQKGIFQISLGTSKPLLTSSPGSMVSCLNASPYCKVVIIYWANEQFQNYLGTNAVKLNKIPYTDKVEYYLCDQNWVKTPNAYKVIIDKIKLASQCTIRLQMTIQSKATQLEDQHIIKKQQTIIQALKMVMNITQIQIIGFPYQALSNPKFIFCLETDTCNYITPQSDLTIWKTDLTLPECRLRGKIYDSLSKNSKEELAVVDGQDVTLSKSFKDYLKHHYANNPSLYTKIIEKDITIEYEMNKYKNKFTDYPYGILEISQNNYIINNKLGQGGFITDSIYDYISIKKIMGRQFIKQIDMPIYAIDFESETLFIDDDKIQIYYETDEQRKIKNQTFNFENSNYAKLTIKQIQMQKEFQDSIEISILYDDQILKTSKCRGNYFGQSFIIPYPVKLNFTILHYVEKEQMSYIQNTFQQVLNLNNLKMIDTQFINLKFISNNKDVILTVQVDLSGFIEDFQNLIIKPECLVQHSMIGEYFIKVYEGYRCISILNQRSTQQNTIIFDNYIYKSDSLLKPFHISLCYSSNKSFTDATILQDLQITSLDLNWRQQQSYKFDKIILNVKREIDPGRSTTPLYDNNKIIQPCKSFLEFTPLKVTYIQEHSYDIVIGSAFQLKYLANDSVERLKDTQNYQFNNQMFEYDRSQLDTLYIPIVTEVLKQTVPFTLITLNQVGQSELNTQQANVIQGNLEPRSGVFYQELADDKGRPYLIHYATRIIKHFRYNLTQQLEVSVHQLKPLKGKSYQVNAINPIDAYQITNHILPTKCEETHGSPTFKFDDIEGSIEFIIYEDSTLYCRHIVNLQQVQFDYDIHSGKGVYALDLDGLKCTLLIKESKQQIENELKSKLSIRFIARLKTLAQRMQRYKFQLNQEKYAFEYSLKYSFINSTLLYAQRYLNQKEKVFQEDELFEYTLAEINSEQFPIYSSVSKIHLGNKKLKFLELVETRLDDMETISQTDVTLRELQICSKNDKFDLTYTTKDDEIKSLNQAHIRYSKIKSPYTIGKFQFTFLRLIKGLLPDYQNRNVIDATPIMIRLKYNHQVKHISNITQFGLNNDGIFKTYEFFVGNVEDTLLIQVKINNIKIAEGEVCVPSVKGKIIVPLPKIRYIHNDMIYHFHKKLNIRDLHLLGIIEFEKLNWVKVFIKLNSLDINLEDQEMTRNNYYIFVAENEKYSWTSKVYPENKKQFSINFNANDIISQLIDDNQKDAQIKLSVKQNSETLAERSLSLKPFIKRLGQVLDFPIKLNNQVTLNATFEISQRFRSKFYKKPNPKVKEAFDFRKQSYQQMLLLIINFQINIDEGLRELYEFIMYNLPNEYDPSLLFKILISLFTSLKDKKKIVTLSLQCIYSIYSSSYEMLDESIKQNISKFLQYIIDTLDQYKPQEEKQQIASYLPDKLPAPLTSIEDIENITQQELQSYLQFNQVKAFIDIFIDNQDTLSGKNYEYILKIFDTYIYGNSERQEQLLTYIKLLYQTQLALSQFHHKVDMTFYSFVNHLIDVFKVKEIQIEELQKEPFTVLQQILQDIFDYIDKNSTEDSLLDCLFIIKQLTLILKTSQKEYLDCLINQLPKSLYNFDNLQIHLGLLVEQFKGHGQNTNIETIKKIVDYDKLESLALSVVTVEYKNVKETTTLNNLFDILIYTLEIGMEQSFSKLETFLKQNQPAQELNKISVEKFLLHLKRKEERQQRLQMLKNKQKGDQPTDINQKKKQLMEKYLITKVSWK